MLEKIKKTDVFFTVVIIYQLIQELGIDNNANESQSLQRLEIKMRKTQTNIRRHNYSFHFKPTNREMSLMLSIPLNINHKNVC